MEWENEFIGCVLAHFPGVLAEPKRVWSKTALDRIEAMKKWVSADRDSAVRGLHECYDGLRRYYFDDPDKMLFLRAAWCFDHYALEWGAGMAIYETTITGPYRHQVGLFHVRARRGNTASRGSGIWPRTITATIRRESIGQRRAELYLDHEFGRGGPEEVSGPGFGMSVSLKRRDMYLAYLSGASIIEHEDWFRVYCRLENGTPPKWTLSPHGEAMKEWYAFTKRHPDRGISYAPVALLTPFNQGMPVWGGKPWSFFPARAARHDDRRLPVHDRAEHAGFAQGQGRRPVQQPLRRHLRRARAESAQRTRFARRIDELQGGDPAGQTSTSTPRWPNA